MGPLTLFLIQEWFCAAAVIMTVVGILWSIMA